MLIEPVPANESGLLHVEDRSAFVRGKIMAFGPMAGSRDGTKHHDFQVGEVVTYNRMSHVPVGPAGMYHLVDDNQILLLE